MTRFLAATVFAVQASVSLAGNTEDLALVGGTVVDVDNFGETGARRWRAFAFCGWG